jgi:DNA replication and repair protein RecF
MTPSRIHRLTLTHFRNYRAASLAPRGDLVVLVGPNGAGKTNCLEAISFLSPGRGLRRATLEDVADNQGDGSWAVSAEVEGALGLSTLGTGIDAPRGDATTNRRCRIDREPVASATAFGDHLRIVWLTPSMDGLFTGAASERRRFFDRLVLAIDAEHSGRVSALERALRSRNRLLEVRNYDDHWCDAIERQTAELAVAVAATRGQTAAKLAAMLRARGQASSAFPAAEIALDGWMENALLSEPATAIEDRYRTVLRENRVRDAAAGRTLDGPHLTDLDVIYAPKNMPARDASTGEQKALLIGLVLAHATLVAEMTGIVPLLLLDEVVAHLDPGRRKALFDELARLGAQVWMSGADPAAFGEIGPSGEIFDVEGGLIRRAG